MDKRRICCGTAFFVACVLLFCGCMSMEGGSSGSRGAGSPIGVLFEWDSEASPLAAGIGGGMAVPSGFGDVNFGVFGDGAVTPAEGALHITAGKTLIIGATPECLLSPTGTGSGDFVTTAHYPGQFDLSQGKFVLTISYQDYNPPAGDTWLRILINNNSAGQFHSVLGTDSVLRHLTTEDTLLTGGATTGLLFQGEPGKMTLTFTPSDRFGRAPTAARNSLRNAFLGICTRNASITVTGIKLERVE